MLATEARQSVWNLCGVPSTHARLTSAVVDQHLYLAQVELVRAATSRGIVPVNLRREVTWTFTNGGAYFLPADALMLVSVSGLGSEGRWRPLTRATTEDLDGLGADWRGTGGIATISPPAYTAYFYEKGQDDDPLSLTFSQREVGFWPSATAGTAIGYYVPRPTAIGTLVTASKPIIYIPDEFHDALCQRAAARFLSEQAENPRPNTVEMYMAYWGQTVRTYLAQVGEGNQMGYRPVLATPLARRFRQHWRGY